MRKYFFDRIFVLGMILGGFFLGGVPIQSHAQISHGGLPYTENPTGVRALRSSGGTNEVPFVEMPPVDRDEMLREDSLSDCKSCGLRFARKFNVSISPQNAGTQTELPDGTRLWRVGIRSKDAYSLNILFTRFDIPPGAKVFIYSPDRNTILGAFTDENRQPGNLLPVAPVDGDELIVEYSEPADAAFRGKIEIGEVNHDYKGLRALPAFHKAQACEVDATCDGRFADSKRSACQLIVNGNVYCSGNLVNNTAEDGKPYVLTSAHCLFDDRNNFMAEKAATTVFFFNYESPYCFSEVQGSMEMSIAGSTVQASAPGCDMLLLLLNDVPPVDYRAYYAGWNATNLVSGPAYCFHHPSGDVKKISIENDTPYTADFNNSGLFEANCHWRVYRWEEGITEGGSSGSGLFDANNRIIGALSGGAANISCALRGDDNFYQLCKNWNSSRTLSATLTPWLDPLNLKVNVWDGKEIESDPCVRISNRQEGEGLQAASFAQGYPAGNNTLGITEFSERFSNEKEGKLYGVYFIPLKGKYSTTDPVYLSVYSGDSLPDQLLYENTVKITNTNYQSSRGFTGVSLTYFREKENYIRFSEPVTVGKTFFVAFRVSPNVESIDTFALYLSVDRPETAVNTAFFKQNDRWLPFNDNPILSAPASLMVDAVVQFSDNSEVHASLADSPRTGVYPNPVKDNATVRFSENGEPLRLSLIDLSGRILFMEEKNLSGREYSLLMESYGKGLFLIEVVYPDHTDRLKIIK